MSNTQILSYPCPVCDENDPNAFRIYFNGYVKLYQCKRCGFVARYPGPGTNIIEKYDDRYSLDFLNKGQEFMYPHRRKVFTDIAKRIKKYINKGRLLDVGCGDGHFLSICQHLGFECYGVEPSKLLSEYASSKIKNPVIQSHYKKELFPKDSFGIITYIQTLEHIPNPLSALQTTKYHLQKGGILVIEVPSIWSPHFLLYRLTGIKRFVAPPTGIIYSHVGYYSPRSIRFLTNSIDYTELCFITGRWRVKYPGMLSIVAQITDPLMNVLKIGGVLYIGKKRI